MYSNKDEILLKSFASLSDKLLELGVISTDSFTGEIGEYYACKAYDLTKSERSNKGFDAININQKRIQVKAKIIDKNYSYSLKNLNTSLFEYLVIVYFDKFYSPIKIIKVNSNLINSNSFNVNKKNIDEFENFDLNKLNIEKSIKKTIYEFALSYNELIEKEIIRSRRIVGDVGEYYASKRLNLLLETNKNSKGIDAKNKDGLSFEIKTRRVYLSERRKSEVRRINNLVNKSADFLIIVTLDREFKCSGMWIMNPKYITNPKSANLKIVNTTIGTLNLIPSKISYLETGNKFNSFKQLTYKNTKTNLNNINKVDFNNQQINNNVMYIFHKDEVKIFLFFIFILFIIGLIENNK